MEYLVHCVLTYLSVPSSCSGSRLDAQVGLVLHPYCLSRQRSHNCRSLGLWLLLLFCEGHWPEQQGQCGHPMPHPCSCLSNRISSRCLERKRICRHWKSEIKLYILLQVIEIIAKLLNFFFCGKQWIYISCIVKAHWLPQLLYYWTVIMLLHHVSHFPMFGQQETSGWCG